MPPRVALVQEKELSLHGRPLPRSALPADGPRPAFRVHDGSLCLPRAISSWLSPVRAPRSQLQWLQKSLDSRVRSVDIFACRGRYQERRAAGSF